MDDRASIARIQSSTARGAGTLIAGGYVVTCAHVITDVLDGPTEAQPGTAVRVEFPFLHGGLALDMELVALGSSKLGTGYNELGLDLALLRLNGELSPTVELPPLLPAPCEEPTSFYTYGWPNGQNNSGLEAFGVLRGRAPGGWLNAYRKDGDLPFPVRGYSGAPALSEHGRAVLGICVERSALDEPERPVAFGRVIPSSEILRWMRRHASPYPGRAPFRTHQAPFYHGHDEFAGDLRRQLFDEGLVVLGGGPASGRTSFVRTRLAHGTRADCFGRVVVIDAGKGLIAALEQQLKVSWASADEKEVRLEALELASRHGGLLVVVDHIEDLLADGSSGDDAIVLRHLCAAAADGRSASDAHLAVLLVVGETVPGELTDLLGRGLPPERQAALPALGYKEVRAAVTEPAHAFGARFAPNLVRRIMNEFRSEQAELNDLAASLARMWEVNSGDEHIPERAFRGFGIERALAAADNPQDLFRELVKEDALLEQLARQRKLRQKGKPKTAPDPPTPERIGELVATAERLEPQLMSARRAAARLALETLRDELNAALTQCARDPSLLQAGLRLAGALFWFWNFESDFAEGRAHLCALLAETDAQARPETAKALYAAGTLAFMTGDMRAARDELGRCIEMWTCLQAREPDAERWKGYAMIVLGRAEDDLKVARRHLLDAEDIMGRVKDGWGLALALNDLGFVVAASGDIADASERFARSISHWRVRGDLWGLPLALTNYGAWAIEAGDTKFAKQALQTALVIHRHVSNRWEMPNTVRHLAELDLREGRVGAALKGFADSLNQGRALGRQQVVTDNLLGIARCLAKRTGDSDASIRAARLLGGWHREVQANHLPTTSAQERSARELRNGLEASLGKVSREEIEKGSNLDLEALIKLASGS